MQRVEDSVEFRGQVTFLDAKLNNGAVEAKHIADNAGVQASKLQHQHRVNYAQESATEAADETREVHVVKGTAGKLLTIKAGCVVACIGDDTITVDLLKGGVSVLTGKITIDSGDAAYALVAGTIDTPDTLAADDVLEIVIDAIHATGTLGAGVFAYVDLEEDYD